MEVAVLLELLYPESIDIDDDLELLYPESVDADVLELPYPESVENIERPYL